VSRPSENNRQAQESLLAEGKAKAIPGNPRKEGPAPKNRALLVSRLASRKDEIFAGVVEGYVAPEWRADLIAFVNASLETYARHVAGAAKSRLLRTAKKEAAVLRHRSKLPPGMPARKFVDGVRRQFEITGEPVPSDRFIRAMRNGLIQTDSERQHCPSGDLYSLTRPTT
jgi:hypothetical protein